MSILAHIPPALLVICRIGGLMVCAPVLGSPAIPVRAKAVIALALGAAFYPVLAADGLAATGLDQNPWLLAPLVATEILIGMLIGFLASLPLTALQVGGVLISQQIGLGFAQLYNPALNEESDVVAQLLYFMAIAVFLLCGGLDATLMAVLHTFERIPAGGLIIDGGIVSVITGLLISALELGLRVAAPLLCIVFLEAVALGFLSRTMPQFNILSLGFPLRILVGLTIVALGATVISDVVLDEIDAGAAAISGWIEGSATPQGDAR